VERIPTIKDLIKRLNDDIAFKLDCGFLVSDAVPSEASYSRLVTKLLECGVWETENENVVRQAIEESFITDDTAATDDTDVEASDQAAHEEEKPEPGPKERSRKSKEEREQWLKDKAEEDANLPLDENNIEAQLDVHLAELCPEVP